MFYIFAIYVTAKNNDRELFSEQPQKLKPLLMFCLRTKLMLKYVNEKHVYMLIIGANLVESYY